MTTDVTLPALGESVTEGTVTRWLKQVGETVAVDEPLLEVSTDKVDTEIPSPVAGTVVEIKVAEDETVEVGTVLATVGTDAESGGADSASASDTSTEPEPAEQSAESRTAPPTAGAIAAEVDGGSAAPAESTEAPAESAEPAPSEAPSEPSEPEAAPAARGGDGDGQGTDVRLPELGESVTEGTVTRWLKQVGETVAVDEPLLEISTDKVDTEI
ncbi:MAG: biotin/lipoyl-containing protein, partial [Nocardioidaceae bacterium]